MGGVELGCRVRGSCGCDSGDGGGGGISGIMVVVEAGEMVVLVMAEGETVMV